MRQVLIKVYSYCRHGLVPYNLYKNANVFAVAVFLWFGSESASRTGHYQAIFCVLLHEKIALSWYRDNHFPMYACLVSYRTWHRPFWLRTDQILAYPIGISTFLIGGLKLHLVSVRSAKIIMILYIIINYLWRQRTSLLKYHAPHRYLLSSFILLFLFILSLSALLSNDSIRQQRWKV